MKSYTDIEQSKKLTELLSFESADMIYMPIMDIDSMSNSGFFDIPECYPFNEFKNSNAKPLPCWSIAALYSVLPAFTLNSSDDKYFRIHCCKKFSEWYNNPIDACYEMIIKLHEQKLL